MATSVDDPQAGPRHPAVTVIGLGEMGSALAGAFLDRGHPTTVWNRTPDKADALVERGARRADDVAGAVAASSVVVVNVAGNRVARELLEAVGQHLAGRVVVNLTDGTSTEARDVAEVVTATGAAYLHGQIMTVAPGIGDPETVVLYGGPESRFAQHRPVLEAIGGKPTLVSTDPGVPELYGMAVHDIMWATLNGFLHAAALLGSEGIKAEDFLDRAGGLVAAISSLLPLVAGEVDRADHGTDFAGLDHHLPSIDHLIEESRVRGIRDDVPGYTRALVGQAIADGHGAESYSRLVDYFRNNPRA